MMTQDTKKMLGIGAIVLLIVGFFYVMSQGNGGSSSQQTFDPKVLVREDSYQTASPASANSVKATLVEFGDFQCPACGYVEVNFLEKLLQEYGGKINFVFRNYPLSQHKNAIPAALAAEAAGEQGKFWEMHHKLYAAQNEWGENDKAPELFVQYAQDLGLNIEQFKQSVQDQKALPKINRDFQDGNSVQVEGTPTFYINNQKYTGGMSYDALKSALNKAISGTDSIMLQK